MPPSEPLIRIAVGAGLALLGNEVLLLVES